MVEILSHIEDSWVDNDNCFFSQMLNLNCNNINEDGMSHVVEILEEKKELEILL